MKIERVLRNASLIVCLIYSFLAVYYGLDRLLNQKREPNQCLMSWMYPNFIPIKIENNKYNYKYSLYLYKEGRQIRQRSPSMNNIPLLFVHGNAGSYKQVRSLGVALAERQSQVGVDVYAVDFDEELSGLHGDLLWQQADFVNMCIDKILSLYNGKHKNVITIGHSMGGMVLRAATMLPNYKNGSIDTIITFSTPHRYCSFFEFHIDNGYREHPGFIDSSLSQFYHKINSFWKKQISIPNSG